MIVFPSNRVLIERCDGIDERTLRRRISHLEKTGILARRSSSNGKRYRVRNEESETILAYGIDLSPAFAMKTQLEELARDCHREESRRTVLRARIRHMLFAFPGAGSAAHREEARLSLRRSLPSDKLQRILDGLESDRIPTPPDVAQATDVMTARDSQNDRHIQISDKESYESDSHSQGLESAASQEERRKSIENPQDITVDECMELATTSRTMASETPQSWDDIVRLSFSLAPAIGIGSRNLQAAEPHLGRHGMALAILGLVEAFDRIKCPGAYLHTLVQCSKRKALDPVRMFKSLVRAPRDFSPEV